MNGFLSGKDISIDLGLDESNHGVYGIGNRRCLRLTALVKSNHTKLVVIIHAHVFLNSETVKRKINRICRYFEKKQSIVKSVNISTYVLFNIDQKNRKLMSGSSHIQSVLIGVEYINCRRILDVYLLFVIWMGQIQSKLIYIFVTYGLASL